MVRVDEPLTLTERISFGLTTLYSLYAAAKASVLYFSVPEPKPPFKTFVNNATIRTLLRRSSPRQVYHAVPRALHVYESWTKRTGQPYEVQAIQGPGGIGANLMWVGEKWSPGSTKKVLVYIHGGGFELPLMSGHVDLCWWIRNQIVKAGNEEPAIALLGYGYTPEHCYPHQLQQAVVAINHLLENGASPSSMVLAGDSAGGNLLLSIISHILHPHPSVPPLEPRKAPFAAVILISPAVTFTVHTAGSMGEYAQTDYLDPPLYARWVSMYKDGTSLDQEVRDGGFWGSPLEAPGTWWSGSNTIATRIHVTAGKCEIFRDDIVRFAEQMGKLEGGSQWEIFVGEKEVHDAPLDDFNNHRPLSSSTRMVAEWVAKALY